MTNIEQGKCPSQFVTDSKFDPMTWTIENNTLKITGLYFKKPFTAIFSKPD